MDVDAVLDTLFDVAPFWIMMLSIGLLSGYLISIHVRRNPDRFRDMTRRSAFIFGIYCALCVAVSMALVSLAAGFAIMLGW